MGAIISMRGRIKSRNALLDIGASGPLAGLVVAIPVLAWGLLHSKIGPTSAHGAHEGQSLLYLAMKRVLLGPIAADHDVVPEPGRLRRLVRTLRDDAEPDPDRPARRRARRLCALRPPPESLRALAASTGCCSGCSRYNVVRFVAALLLHRAWDDVRQAIGNSLFWLMWFGLLTCMKRIGGRDHPPTEPGELTRGRKAIAVALARALRRCSSCRRRGRSIEARASVLANLSLSASHTGAGA